MVHMEAVGFKMGSDGTVLWVAPDGVRCVPREYDHNRYQLRLLRGDGTVKSDLFQDYAQALRESDRWRRQRELKEILHNSKPGTDPHVGPNPCPGVHVRVQPPGWQSSSSAHRAMSLSVTSAVCTLASTRNLQARPATSPSLVNRETDQLIPSDHRQPRRERAERSREPEPPR
jgi:hypothetical protein